MEEKSPKRALFKKSDMIIISVILAVALIALGVFAFIKKSAKDSKLWAVVNVQGYDVCRVDLSLDAEPFEIDFNQLLNVPVKLDVTNHQIRFLEVECPDHICTAYGYISRKMDIAVCMPNQVSIIIYDGEEVAQMDEQYKAQQKEFEKMLEEEAAAQGKTVDELLAELQPSS